MVRHHVRRRGEPATFSSLRDRQDQPPYSPLERFYLTLPWILIVCLAMVAKWSSEQIQALLVCLVPAVLVGAPRIRQA